MNTETTGQDPELQFAPNSADERQTVQDYNDDCNPKNSYPFTRDRFKFSVKDLSSSNIAAGHVGRNKRKNFSPRYTSTSPMDSTNASPNTMTASDNPESGDDHHHPSRFSETEKVSKSAESLMGGESSAGPFASDVGAQSALEIPPWVQMFRHYAPASLMAQYPVPSGSGSGSFHMEPRENAMQAAVSDMSEWVRKFGCSESAVSAIRDIFKAYQEREAAELHHDGNGSVNLSTETEPPTPPTTPQTYNHSRLNIPNGSGHHETPPSAYTSPLQSSPIKDEIIHLSPPPAPLSEMSNVRESPRTPNSLPQSGNFQWDCTQSDARDDYAHEKWNKKKDSSGDDEEDSYNNNNQAIKIQQEKEQFSSHHDDSSDCCDRQQRASGSLSRHHLPHWCKDLQQNPPESFDKSVKSECDDTDTTAGDADDNPYDDDDYPASLNDFSDSANDDEDDEDAYSVGLFPEDQRSPIDEQMRTQVKEKFYAVETDADSDQNRSLVVGKEESCSNSSSKISIRNLGGGFLEQNQLRLVSSKSRCGVDDNNIQSDYVQNMSKFASYLECQNEVCRFDNIREHYHCYDFPCFGKTLSKKEEVIRHVKWHRKRMESLSHGFMRFSSSDDCSTTFGGNCQHNRKQTHYHCFQPNCDRVYISTSDVQMHSNFHRKDSAIHKEGFQRFRANEKCSADYCMFAGQKTTHFHCRRENCRYTFKNKADMEKHKTYHIKDMKLARDGFKKFLKNEPCPFKMCRFSRVCNHIHCARENCFYVLHSSGQLLSHKRKHERMDNEQTYCRYKMLAVKAALLGNHSAAAVPRLNPDASAYNFTNSLLQLKEFENSSQLIPTTTSSEPLLSSPNQKLIGKDLAAKPATFSMEFLHQMKQRHEELLKSDQLQHPPEPTIGSEFSLFPVNASPSSPQHQYNMGLDPNHLTPSTIEQFFTSECPYRNRDKDEPINLKSLASNDENIPKKGHNSPQCLWEARLEPHLHCIVKDCQAVIPNNVLDISAHIRIHGYNRDVYATTSAAASTEPLAGAATAVSSNPMQITTIDGFFNRKRGRPPKNRFVEVYKNAQQSPQAIFTSFKLEKQAISKDRSPVGDASPSQLSSQLPVSLSGSASGDPQQRLQSAEENRLMNLCLTTQSLAQATVQNLIASQFTTYKANEHCGIPGSYCSLAMQHHYHCACSADCNFITAERDLLSVHLERQHTTQSFADRISKKFKRFDRNIGLDCGIIECRLRKTRPHLHCRQCYHQISPFDLETHICVNSEQTSVPPNPLRKLSTISGPEHQHQQTELSGENFTIRSNKSIIGDYSSRLPSVTFSTLNELRRKVSEIEPETSSLPKRTHEDEKVFVVRAAGTYFPENTTELSGTASQSQQKATPSSAAAECMQSQIGTSAPSFCSTPYCKMKRKPHEHCQFCDQSFMDPAKIKMHRLKHIGATEQMKPSPNHYPSLNSIDAANEENMKSGYPQAPPCMPTTYDEQPQDLSLSPNTAAAANQDDGLKPTRESLPAPSPLLSPGTGPIANIFPQNVMCGLSMQNFHLAQLATLYQQNPYYYQHLYPFLSNAAALTRHHQQRQSQTFRAPCNDDKQYPADCSKSPAPAGVPPSGQQFPFLNPFLLGRTTETAITKPTTSVPVPPPSIAPLGSTTPPALATAKSLKRKLTNGGDDFSAFIERLSPSTKKQMQFAAGLAAAAAAAAATTGKTAIGNSRASSTSSGNLEQHGQHFKIKDEQIPTGYLKFRFNEDCYFPKCGYRNHQSHFHCDRNDCHYSFCDKTRFVQHTARHERLDKLMGNDFRQYRANMNCGYENCPYFKNLGSANKSSHFHCLKCDFICSDTNKVVAHRRQHSKMEYIRMAGFRKVTNSEKCNSTFEATVSTSNSDSPGGTVECSYSQKQTHYHCLVCDVSVLSRAQLASHKHKT